MTMIRWIILIICLAGLCILVGCGWIIWQQTQRKAELTQISNLLGNSPANQLGQNTRCWDIFTHCGYYIYFLTPLSQSQVATTIGEIGYVIRWEDQIDGYTAYSTINLWTSHRLTANGEDGTIREDPTLTPKAYLWRLTGVQGQEWGVSFYAIGDPSIPYLLDGQSVNQNLIVLMTQIR